MAARPCRLAVMGANPSVFAFPGNTPGRAGCATGIIRDGSRRPHGPIQQLSGVFLHFSYTPWDSRHIPAPVRNSLVRCRPGLLVGSRHLTPYTVHLTYFGTDLEGHTGQSSNFLVCLQFRDTTRDLRDIPAPVRNSLVRCRPGLLVGSRHLTPYTVHLTSYTLHLTPCTLHLAPCITNRGSPGR